MLYNYHDSEIYKESSTNKEPDDIIKQLNYGALNSSQSTVNPFNVLLLQKYKSMVPPLWLAFLKQVFIPDVVFREDG